MGSSFEQMMEKIKAEVKVTDKGKIKRTFSRETFEQTVRALANDPEYKVEKAQWKNGKVETVDVYPAAVIRKVVERILRDVAQMDPQEAAAQAEQYEIPAIDGWYDFVSEAMYAYLKAGKKFDFIPKYDSNLSLFIEPKDAGVKVSRTIANEKKGIESREITNQIDAHQKLVAKTKVPKWLKRQVK